MYHELYEKGTPSDESQIVAELIEQAIILASVDLDLTMQFLSDGLMATVLLKPPHHASWSLFWKHENPRTIDTGTDPMPSLANPKIQELLTEDMRKIFIQLHVFCRCPACRTKN